MGPRKLQRSGLDEWAGLVCFWGLRSARAKQRVSLRDMIWVGSGDGNLAGGHSEQKCMFEFSFGK